MPRVMISLNQANLAQLVKVAKREDRPTAVQAAIYVVRGLEIERLARADPALSRESLSRLTAEGGW